jgi:hypothetical protein
VTGRVELVGGATFARTLRAFGDELGQLTAAHTAAGSEVARLASARARRRTGALASSFAVAVTDAGPEIGSPLVYAGVQEFGWARHRITPSYALTSALGDSAPAVTDVYHAAVDAALSNVRGK